MRKKIAAGNWKMNNTYNQSMDLVEKILDAELPEDVEVILATPFLYLTDVHELTHASSNVEVAAQNCHHEKSGAYTGEISAAMIESVGVKYVIVGHSERREYFNETEDIISKKLVLLHELGLTPIYCCGEPLLIRKEGSHADYVLNQLKGSLLKLEESQILKTIVAYEPIWAIGTGETASPEQAQEMHEVIRKAIAANYSQDVADKISILYGGSVKGNNAKDIFSKPDVDGGLVGGASLNGEEFITICNSF